MGSKLWFKNIISKKKAKGSKNINGCNKGHGMEKQCTVLSCDASLDNQNKLEDAAATRIQTAYRAYVVRKTFHQMRGMGRLRNLLKCDFVKKQASNTLSHLHSWSRIQTQIRARRVDMVTEGRMRQKKQENQLKLEAKLHDLEVEWSGGFETMDKALAKIHQREEAALKRERAMAYAFSHQWRANSNPSFGSGNNELSKENWGWSWTDRWIAARPWERRVAPQGSPDKASGRKPSKTTKNGISPTSKTPVKAKLISPNAKAATKARKLSFEGIDQKTAAQKAKPQEEKIKNEQEGS